MSGKNSIGGTSGGAAKSDSAGQRRTWAGLFFAIAVTGLALLVRILLDPFLGNHLPYVAFFVAVAVATWRGSLATSLLTVALGALAANWFFMPPRHSFVIEGVAQKVGMATYFMVSLAFVAFGYALHRAQRRADREEEQMQLVERKAEKALRESEARKSAVLDSSLDGVITMDARGVITEFNPAAEALFGHRAATVMGRPLADVLIPERLREDHNRGLARYLATGEGRVLDRRLEMPALRADGTEFVAELSIRRVAGIEPPLFSGFLRDVTARKQTESALRQSQIELEEANAQLASHAKQLEALVQQRTAKLTETIGELEGFSYSITHDLRAPLRAVNSFSQMLTEEYGEKLDEHGKGLLARIAQSVTRMDKLIQDVLQYSRVLRMDLKLESVNPDQLVRGMLQSYPDFQEPKATIILASHLPQVLANEAALTQCFSNLLNNAVKFVAAGTKPLVTIRPEAKRSTVRFWIEDNGIGIEPEYQEKIFELFQRLSNDYQGTGVGLSIVRKAVERMGGTAGVESELGKGSRFWIELKAPNTERKNV